MYRITSTEVLVSLLALILMGAIAARALLGDRKRDREARSAPFRNYFDPGYQREPLRHSDLRESEDERTCRASRSTPFLLRHPDAIPPKAIANERARRGCNTD